MTDTVHITAATDASEPLSASPHAIVGRSDAPTISPEIAFRPYRDLGKRVLDVAAVLASAVLVLPLMLVLAALVARDGHPPFFRQKRVGRDGRVFTILKLRTMIPDAERALHEIVQTDPEAAREWQRNQKLLRDPRVTPLGAFLRRSSLDELPQLWNVLVGEMSLVGPRPMMPGQRELYDGAAYYRLRPGITGLWQVSARNGSTFDSRVAYDERYHDEVSLWLDLLTLARTAVVVVRGTGC